MVRRFHISASLIAAVALVSAGCTSTVTGQGSAGSSPVSSSTSSAASESSQVEEAEASVSPSSEEPEQPPAPTDVTVHWLATMGDTGTTGTTVISRTPPKTPGDFRVEFSSNEVGGIGSQSQAGAWNAAIASVLLLGQPLEGQFRFETDGFIDGPSAGALTAVGLFALARGTELLPDATMTGTINTSGMIGPVGGIPEKIVGAQEAGFTTVLIPLGQRNTQNMLGETVDVVNLGDRIGVTVKEVGDIYQAYSELTGDTIDLQGVGRDPELDNASYNKIKPQADAIMARFQSAVKDFQRLPAEIQTMFGSEALETADDYAAQASDLQVQGLQAGAFERAAAATVMAEALTAVGELFVPLYTQGEAGLATLFEHAQDYSDTELKFMSLLDQLSGYTPRTVADVEGLVGTYAQAFDAYSLLMFAQNQIAAIQQNDEQGGYASVDEIIADLLSPVMMSSLAASLVDVAKSYFEIGRDNPGAPISSEVDLAQVGEFFRRGAEANYAAFVADFVHPYATSNGVSDDVMLNYLTNADLTVALAIAGSNVAPSIANYIGPDKPNAQYAMLAYGLQNFARNQGLVNKYYNNAILDENFVVVGAMFDKVVARALELGRQQLSAEIELLRSNSTEPVLSVASYESAGLDRTGGIEEQFGAMTAYDGAFLVARTLAYLAGIEQPSFGG